MGMVHCDLSNKRALFKNPSSGVNFYFFPHVNTLVGGWATLLKNMSSSIGMIFEIPNIFVGTIFNQNATKPPTRL